MADSLGLASYIYSLDGSTTYTYLAYATSTFGEHSLISSIQVAQSIIRKLFRHGKALALSNNLITVACGKPVIAKIADTTSRGTAYLTVCKCSLSRKYPSNAKRNACYYQCCSMCSATSSLPLLTASAPSLVVSFSTLCTFASLYGNLRLTDDVAHSGYT